MGIPEICCPKYFPYFMKKRYQGTDITKTIYNIPKISMNGCQETVPLTKANTYVVWSLVDSFKLKFKPKTIMRANIKLKFKGKLNECPIEYPEKSFYNEVDLINSNFQFSIEGKYPIIEIFNKMYFVEIPHQEYLLSFEKNDCDFIAIHASVFLEIDKLSISHRPPHPPQFSKGQYIGSLIISTYKYILGEKINYYEKKFTIHN